MLHYLRVKFLLFYNNRVVFFLLLAEIIQLKVFIELLFIYLINRFLSLTLCSGDLTIQLVLHSAKRLEERKMSTR